jgi:prepilin-type N-terminal cleavage/methylation domain-containing protein
MRRRTGRQSGFTMIELLLGLAVSAMVLAAAAGLAYAVSHAWSKSEDINTVVTHGRNGLFQISDRLRMARAVGYSTSNLIVFWREDDNGDGVINESELSLMTVQSGQLVEGRYVFDANVSAATREANNAPVSRTLFTSATIASRMQSNTYYRAGALAENVDSVTFLLDRAPPTTRMVQVSLRVSVNGLSQALVCGMALRAPLEVQ